MSYRTCKDCRWMKPEMPGSKDMEFATCTRPGVPIDRVTGELEDDWFCDLEREDGPILCLFMGTCGYNGRFYEPKELK